MEIKIAGRSVPVGSRLYHIGWDTFGMVTGYDPTGSAIMKITNRTGMERTILVQNGGKVNGVKLVYWHEKINLDLPVGDVTMLQTIVDTVSNEMMKVMENCNGKD